MKKHILVISQLFYPEQFRINDICLEWIKRGYKVTVLTGIPNYPEGKYYDGYGLFKNRREIYNGIEIIRIPLIPRGHSPLAFILNYLSFVVSGFFWKVFSKVKADYVFIFEVSPMTQALPGIWYAKKMSIPCYIYIQDLWPESVELIFGTKNKSVMNFIGRMVDYIYERCTKIFTASEGFAELISGRGVPREKLEYWPQYAEDFYIPLPRKPIPEIPEDGVFNIIFAGNIGVAQGLEILPRVSKLLGEAEVDFRFRFNIVGDGRYKAELIQLVESMGQEDNFNFIPRQPSTRIPEFMAANDLAFLGLVDNPILSRTVPAKLQSHMACGIPTVASAAGETARIIFKSSSGVCSPPGDTEKLVENILMLSKQTDEDLKAMGRSGRAYYDKHFDKQQLLGKMDMHFTSAP